MFEKEAEEYVRKIRHDVINWDGAEPEERFYNEIKFKQAYLAGAELGYNKANERHYPSKGEYPKGSEKMTKEEIKQKTNLCFLLNPNISEEEKICVIEKVMETKATIVPKAALCNIITYILKHNAELQEKLNIRSCQNCKHNNKSCPRDGSCVH